MLRDLLLNGVAFRPYYAPEDAPGPAAGDGDDLPSPAPPPAGDGTPPAAPAAGASGEDAVPPSGFDVLPDWAKKQLNRQHGKIKEREDALAAARAENARLKELFDAEQRRRAQPAAGDGAPPAAPAPAPAAPATPAAAVSDDDPRVLARAREIVQTQTYQAALNDLNSKGEEAYKDKWGKALEDLKALGGFDQATLEQIVATENPAKVLYEMGSNPDLYQKLMDLPTPAKRFTEFVKLAMTAAPAPAVPAKRPSDAPAPVEALGGRGGAR